MRTPAELVNSEPATAELQPDEPQPVALPQSVPEQAADKPLEPPLTAQEQVAPAQEPASPAQEQAVPEPEPELQPERAEPQWIEPEPERTELLALPELTEPYQPQSHWRTARQSEPAERLVQQAELQPAEQPVQPAPHSLPNPARTDRWQTPPPMHRAVH